MELAPSAGDAPPSPVQVLDDRLRGRWRLAIAIGLGLGLAFGAAGYLLGPVRYRSVGAIRVTPVGQSILYETTESGAVPRYEGLVQTQAVLVRSPRVIQRALRDTEIAETGLARRPDAVEAVSGRLSAIAVSKTELVEVGFEAAEAAEAQRVLNAVLRSYDDLYGGDQGGEFRTRRLAVLRDERARLREARAAKRQEIQAFVTDSRWGAENVQQVLEAKLVRIETLDQERERLEIALAAVGGDPAERGDGPDDDASGEPTLGDLVLVDPEIDRMVVTRDDLVLQLDRLRTRFGDGHLLIRQAARDLEDLDHQLADRIARARAEWDATGGAPEIALGGTSGDPARMEAQRTLIARLIERNRLEVRSLNEDQARLTDLRTDADQIDDELADVEEKLRVLEVEREAQPGGRITIEQFGLAPMRPWKDRRIPLAVVGLGGGLGASLAFFFMLGTLDRRAYSSSQLRRAPAGLRCLGVLPHLGGGRIDPETSETAAQCVHQIRNRIESLRARGSTFVLVVTSPYQGDGKTSLAMALGWSYAAAGYRTVMVDGDWYGQSLSAQMGVADRVGLKEVLRDRTLGDRVEATAVPNLFVLGAGADARIGPESIRRDDFEAFTGDLRLHFDVVIIDTGPALGSVELYPVAAAADGMVFAVRRGRSRDSFDVLVEDLAGLRVPLLGVVLNCADAADCERYVSKSTVSMRRVPAEPGAMVPASPRGNRLVQAIEDVNERR